MKTNAILSITFSAFVFIFAPFLTYSNNVLEIFINHNVILIHGIMFMVSSLLLFAILHFSSEKISKTLSSIIAVIMLILFVEGNFVNYKFGVLNGAKINWLEYHFAITLELVISIILIASAIVYYKKIYKAILRFSIFILILSIIYSGLAVYQNIKDGIYESKSKAIKEQHDYTNDLYLFSKKDNILIIVPDGYSCGLFDKILESNDGDKIKEIFKDFTYFKNNIGLFPTTVMSMPFIRSGQMYDNTITRDEFLEQNSEYMLENKLKDRISTVHRMPVRADNYTLMTVVALRFAPIYIKQFLFYPEFLYGNIHPDIEFYNNLNNITYTDKKVFKYIHLVGMHPPFRMNKNVTVNSVATYLDTGIAELVIISKLLDNLKQAGVYDNSLIFVAGDHGVTPLTATDTKYSTPVMLAKNYNTTNNELTFNNANVTIGDIPNTIFSTLKMPLNPFGENIFNIKKDNKERMLKYCHYIWEHEYWQKNYLPKMTCYKVKNRQILK